MSSWKRVCVVLALAGLLFVPATALADSNETIAVFKLRGSLQESPGEMDMSALLGSRAPLNMFDLLKSLREARSDSDLRAVIFDIEDSAIGFGQTQELRAQFEALRAADKDVLIYAETLRPGTLLLGSAATQLVMLPTGWLDFSGMYGEALYFKNLMEKLRLEADILHCGDFKSAGEPFYRTGPSKEAEEQTNWLLDSLFEQLVAEIAKSRRLTPEVVRELVDKGMFHATEALDAKLVDKLQYRDDFVQSVKRKYGEDTKVVYDYGREKGPDLDIKTPWDLINVFTELMKGPSEPTQPAVAVVYVEGPIVSGESEPSFFGGAGNAASGSIRKAIAKALKDDTVKALVLRVDSPGGSAIASEVICEATERFKDSGRPLIVSMGNVAGSGGYYVSTLADTIFAEPGTITGSIGVVGGKIVTKGFWDWIGVTGKEYKRGKLSDTMSTNRRFTEEQREIVMNTMNRVYGEFKGRVKDGRGDRIKGDLESLAGGRVYTGRQAIDNGLVDRLGGLADAIKFAANEAEISTYDVRVYPRPKTIFDMFAEAFGGKEDDNDFVSLTTKTAKLPLGAKFGALPGAMTTLEALRAIDPTKAVEVEKFMIQLEMLSDESVLLIIPALATFPN